MARSNTKIPVNVRELVLTEAGYRCAVPTCRLPTPIDVHHIKPLADGGTDDAENLIVLCASCHVRYHREGRPSRSAILAYKTILRSISRGFDWESVDLLLFVYSKANLSQLHISGDGILRFAKLLVAGLIDYGPVQLGANVVRGSYYRYYSLRPTERGETLVRLWKSGDMEALKTCLGVVPLDS